MKLQCPECGKDDCITGEYFSPLWIPERGEWAGGDEIVGPYTCQHCYFESKYLGPFEVEEPEPEKAEHQLDLFEDAA